MYIWQSLGTKLYLREKIKFLSKSLSFPIQVIWINRRYPIGPGLKRKQPKVKIISAHIKIKKSKNILKKCIEYLIHGVTIVCFPSFLSFLWLFCSSLSCFAFLRSLNISYGIVLTPVRTGGLVKMSWVDGIMTHSKLKCLNFYFLLFFQLPQTFPRNSDKTWD